jgi:hypothetical protein
MSTVQCVHGAQINFVEVTIFNLYECITAYVSSLRDVAGMGFLALAVRGYGDEANSSIFKGTVS